MTAPAIDAAADAVLIIYDGDCSFCSAYARVIALRQSIGSLELLSARADDPRVDHYATRGYDLDEGMLLVCGGQVHAGADAMHWLAVHGPGPAWSDKLQSAVFRHRGLARWLYPCLKLGRRVWLALRGRRLIRETRKGGR